MIFILRQEDICSCRHYQRTKNKEVSKDTDAITRVFHVSHTDEQMEDELNTIVDMGGRVLMYT